jgi:IclR family acetate operon transcriptional repressor
MTILPIAGEDASGGPVHNQSVLKAVGLIGCFVDSAEGKTLTELARRTGMNVSTAYRMLQTLTRTGVLRRNEGEERYFVGPLLLALAGSTFSGSGYGAVTDVLAGVAEETGESVSLGIRDADCVAVLLAAGSSQQLRFEHRAGARVPLHCSAMGKALAAFGAVPFPEVVRGLGRLVPATPRSMIRPDQLVADLELTRARGYAVSDEEQHIGVRSVAVPVRRGNEPPRAAIGVQGPTGRMTDACIEGILAVLKNAADLVAKLPMLDRLPGG